MHLFQRFLCLFGVHRRSRGAAVHYPDALRSICRGCHAPMIKDQHGWRIDRDPIPAMPPSPFT
ncbi:hypothetical protein [Sphingomonas sp. DT-204]|uniref:hypothetical protein n=1 Tax=Sphingomonas sp. DT-204 TaxID=3396166 RepID=UPI003F19F963